MQSNSDIFLEEREAEGSEWVDGYGYADIREEEIEKINDEAYEDFLNSNKASLAIDLFKKGSTKAEIKKAVQEAIDSVLEQGNVLQVAESISAMELFIKEVKADKRFTDYVREEAGKTPKGYVSKSGAKIELAETGSSYDFSKCGDVELDMLDAALKTAENNLKERKEFLKKIPLAGIDVIVPYSGEVIHIYPPAKSSNSSYKVTLSK